jgi:hypothetical protein
MRRVAGTAALFLLLAVPMGATLHVGWTEDAQRVGVVALMDQIRQSDCRAPQSIVRPRPVRSIHWPREFHSRRQAAPR